MCVNLPRKSLLKKHVYNSVYRNVQNRQIPGDREQITVCQVLGGGEWEGTDNGYWVSSGGNENVLELDGGDGCKTW